MENKAIVADIIKRSQLKDEEISMLSMMHHMMQEQNRDMKEVIEKTVSEQVASSVEAKMESFNAGLEPLFDDIMKKHIEYVNSMLNHFLQLHNENSLTKESFLSEIKKIQSVMDDPDIKEARTLSSKDMQLIYKNVVEPIKQKMDDESVIINRNLKKVRDNIMDQAEAYGDVEQDFFKYLKSKLADLSNKSTSIQRRVEALPTTSGFIR